VACAADGMVIRREDGTERREGRRHILQEEVTRRARERERESNGEIIKMTSLYSLDCRLQATTMEMCVFISS